ncbi:MAG: hypothetical protein ACFB0Z_09665 [Candidatus Phaeomarinobacter sp.]
MNLHGGTTFSVGVLVLATTGLLTSVASAQDAALVDDTQATEETVEVLPVTPTSADVTPDVIADLRQFVDTEIVRASIANQNKKHAGMSEGDILALDDTWRAERKADSQPLIAATLTNPLSSYLTRVQAQAIGLYTEIFVVDAIGLNVGQSGVTSDYWQGDEAKFQKTYPIAADAVFVDEPEFDDALGIWRTQVNMTVADASGTDAIGAVTIEVNLSELQRRQSVSPL